MAKKYKFKTEMKQMLHLIIHSLYTHPEVFIRELVSNSSDALNKIRFKSLTDKDIYQPDKELSIHINIDKENNEFSITDTGIGMTEDELKSQIGTVASSGTLEFFKNMKDGDSKIDANLIGQFGVGFYSVFMVTDEVIVETRSANPDSKSLRWKSKGEENFTIQEIDDIDRGTTIRFKLKDEFKEFSEDYSVKNVLTKYSNFVDFPIFLNDEQVNSIKALWHRKKDEIKDEEMNEFYKFISNDFENPMGHIHLDIEGNVNFKALLFIPSTAPPMFMREVSDKTIQLYSNKVFISDSISEILPEYLRFVKGVVDTEDLPLNVSREVVQSSPLTAKIRQVLTSRILQILEDWSKNEKDKYLKFFNEFGSLLKMGITSDFSSREKLLELYRFPTSHVENDTLTGFEEYKARMKPEQKEIYYITGDSLNSIKSNPNLEYFSKKDYEVIFLADPVDAFVIPYVFEYNKTPLVSIDKADIDKNEEEADKETQENQNDLTQLIEIFKNKLGDKVEDIRISKRLVDSPVTLVPGNSGIDAQTEKMMQMMDKDFKPSKKVLEINPSHELILNLDRLKDNNPDDEKLELSILQLFDGANLLYGNVESPAEFVNRMFKLMSDATK